MKNTFKIGLISFIFALLDLLTKHLAQKFLSSGNFDLFLGMKFTLAFNEGIAFSLPIKGLLQIVLSLVLLGSLFYYAKKHWNLNEFIAQISIGLICGGALGNLYERILFGKVTDFISVFSWFPTFNLADSFIFIGVGLILVLEGKLELRTKN